MPQELVLTDTDRVGKGRTMTTVVTLYRDGTMTFKNTSKSVNFTKGLRGHSFYAVLVDNNGRSLFLSNVFYPPTVAAQGDPFGDSEIIASFRDKVPECIARDTVRVDVIHDAGGLNDQWAQFKGNIKRALKDIAEVAGDVKAELDKW